MLEIIPNHSYSSLPLPCLSQVLLFTSVESYFESLSGDLHPHVLVSKLYLKDLCVIAFIFNSHFTGVYPVANVDFVAMFLSTTGIKCRALSCSTRTSLLYTFLIYMMTPLEGALGITWSSLFSIAGMPIQLCLSLEAHFILEVETFHVGSPALIL